MHVSQWEAMGVTLTEVIVETEAASRALGKAVGAYMTLECAAMRHRDLDARLAMANLLGEEIARMLPREGDAPVLVVGLGNRRVTPDSLGPQAVDRTLVTRHMFEELPGFADERMRSVCAIAPGVLGVTGVETMEMIEALTAKVRPQAILCIDSLAARAASRIGAAIQITDNRHTARLRRGQPPQEPDPGSIGRARDRRRHAHRDLRGHAGARRHAGAFPRIRPRMRSIPAEQALLAGDHGDMVVTPARGRRPHRRCGGRHRLRCQPTPCSRTSPRKRSWR